MKTVLAETLSANQAIPPPTSFETTVALLMERIIPLRSVPGYLPRRNGRKIGDATIYRWANRGCKGVILETALLGNISYTSREALDRFFAALQSNRRSKHIRQRSPAQISRAADAAGKQLTEMGVG